MAEVKLTVNVVESLAAKEMKIFLCGDQKQSKKTEHAPLGYLIYNSLPNILK